MKIWIVWRVNVWKSSLFNKLHGSHRAIVTDISGTTREIISEKWTMEEWKDSIVFDSPWLNDFTEELKFIEKIIKDSDVILFVVDSKVWLVPNDYEIKDLIIKNNKKNNTIIVANKLDSKVYSKEVQVLISEFYNLGFNNVIGISAKQGDWLVELRDMILKLSNKLKIEHTEIQEDKDFIPLAILWRPNVGKSTLLNKFSWEEISVVSEVAWTTLDYLISDINYNKKKYRLFDTAWIRKKWKIHWLEKIAYEKTVSMIKYVKPIIIVLIDLIEWLTHRDMSLIWDLIKLDQPIIVAVNKIDDFDKKTVDKMIKKIALMFDFAKWLPIIPISAKEWIWLPKLLDFVNNIRKEWNKIIQTSNINKALNEAWINNPPRFPKNKICKFYYSTQIDKNPPKFKIFINKKSNVNFAFTKWIDNVIRKNFWFVWMPIVIDFQEKEWVGRYSDN
jgi:GTP-binding protein